MDRRMEMDSDLHPPRKRLRADLNLTPECTSPLGSPSPAATVPLNRRHLPDVSVLKPEERGIRLIQLLLASATQTACSNLSRADACLRLVSSLSSPSGDPMQRLAARLATSLATRLLRHRWHGILASLRRRTPSVGDPDPQLAFARALPYRPFAHAVAGRTLLRALADERVVHLVELGASHSSFDLWAPVLRALSRVPRGIKLTCVSPDRSVLESLGSAVAKEVETLDVPFQFNPVNSSLRELDLEALRVRTGEAVAVVSILSLHELLASPQDDEDEEEDEEEKETEDPMGSVEPQQQQQRSGRKMEQFLSALRSKSPKVVVVVEQESDHNLRRMVDRFGEALHYYSAVFHSVELAAGGGLMTREERAAVEEMLGKEMENVVACEGAERLERHERTARWVARMARAKFRQVSVSKEAGEEGRRVVESWPGESRYSVVVHGGCPTICWRHRPLYVVSAWQCC